MTIARSGVMAPNAIPNNTKCPTMETSEDPGTATRIDSASTPSTVAVRRTALKRRTSSGAMYLPGIEITDATPAHTATDAV